MIANFYSFKFSHYVIVLMVPYWWLPFAGYYLIDLPYRYWISKADMHVVLLSCASLEFFLIILLPLQCKYILIQTCVPSIICRLEIMTVNHLDASTHYGDVIMGTIASQITSPTIVYSTVYLYADQRNHQGSASLAFVRGIHRGPVNSPHKWPVTRKMFPFDGVITWHLSIILNRHSTKPPWHHKQGEMNTFDNFWATILKLQHNSTQLT